LRYFVELAFDGTHYHGWQRQPNALSVQQVLEESISTLLGDEVNIVGAGRTDAGVHARQMIAHFDHRGEIDQHQLMFRWNSFLPRDIAINSVKPVKPEAHARFDANSRSYLYRIHLQKDPFLEQRSYYLHHSLDLDLMNEASEVLLQYSDFECFSKSKTDVKTFLCDISWAKWTREDHVLEFHITADRFLRNMVRAIVGTMIHIGSAKIDLKDLHRIIESKDRSQAGYSVPAHGLYLNRVTYPESLFLNA
jgi:tRNA pseudouridine38-40 synthase